MRTLKQQPKQHKFSYSFILSIFVINLTHFACQSEIKVRVKQSAALKKTPAEAPDAPRTISAEFERSFYQTLSTKRLLVDSSLVAGFDTISVDLGPNMLLGAVTVYNGGVRDIDPNMTKMVLFDSPSEIMRSMSYGENRLSLFLKSGDELIGQSDGDQVVVLRDFDIFSVTPSANAAPQRVTVGGNKFQTWLPPMGGGTHTSDNGLFTLTVGFNSIINY